MNLDSEVNFAKAGGPDSWKYELINRLRLAVAGTSVNRLLEDVLNGTKESGIHLAVFVEPYLSLIFEGKKTIESRFSSNRHAPFEQVRVGDLLVLKRSSGPICGLCRVSHVWYYRLDPETWFEIEQFAGALCMDNSQFWQKKKAANFASLMRIEDVCQIPNFAIEKLDPRGWVVLKSPPQQRSLL